MKKTIRLIAMALAVMMLLSSFAVPAFAQQEVKELKIMSYNVAGLPVSLDAPINQMAIGTYISQSDFDIVALQEDFGFHELLMGNLDKKLFPYVTAHTGGVPGGDGLNIISKTGIFNEARITWEASNGILDGGNDELTPKGILFAVIDLGDGVYLDFYNLHADAYGTPGDQQARKAQYEQLAKIIKERDSKNPIIVTGDFNTSIHYGCLSGNALRQELYEGCGLKDAWHEVHNDGNYTDFSKWGDVYGYGYEASAGIWDSIEKVLYKDGEGVKLVPTEFSYNVLGTESREYSDHPAVFTTFTYEKTEDFMGKEEDVEVVRPDKNRNLFQFIRTLLIDLWKLLTNFDALKELIGIG